ncbi:dihydrodipicolinate synthase family protein [Rhizobium sp. RCAM05350]|nr:dihydrodipicolinate synthase family protein [Rhizobium sp. RCAM05350]
MDLPLVVGLAPQRTATDLSPRTLERLATLPSVVGIADETADIASGGNVRCPASTVRALFRS